MANNKANVNTAGNPLKQQWDIKNIIKECIPGNEYVSKGIDHVKVHKANYATGAAGAGVGLALGRKFCKKKNLHGRKKKLAMLASLAIGEAAAFGTKYVAGKAINKYNARKAQKNFSMSSSNGITYTFSDFSSFKKNTTKAPSSALAKSSIGNANFAKNLARPTDAAKASSTFKSKVKGAIDKFANFTKNTGLTWRHSPDYYEKGLGRQLSNNASNNLRDKGSIKESGVIGQGVRGLARGAGYVAGTTVGRNIDKFRNKFGNFQPKYNKSFSYEDDAKEVIKNLIEDKNFSKTKQSTSEFFKETYYGAKNKLRRLLNKKKSPKLNNAKTQEEINDRYQNLDNADEKFGKVVMEGEDAGKIEYDSASARIADSLIDHAGATGALTGAAIGLMSKKKKVKKALIGATVGAVIGKTAGYFAKQIAKAKNTTTLTKDFSNFYDESLINGKDDDSVLGDSAALSLGEAKSATNNAFKDKNFGFKSGLETNMYSSSSKKEFKDDIVRTFSISNNENDLNSPKLYLN